MELSALPAGCGTIQVITGERGAGKTTTCQSIITQVRAAGQTAAGLLTPGRFLDGQKTGIHVVDLSSGEQRLLASALPGEFPGLALGCWTFDEQAIAWGNQRLAEVPPTDLLVIDELGPLEFKRQQGWMAAFDVLRRRAFRLALVVIRPECLESFSNLGFDFECKEIVSPRPPSH
jgi:nucleoside-triphosphatase